MWNALSLYKCTLGLKIINFRSESMNRGEGEMKIIWKKRGTRVSFHFLNWIKVFKIYQKTTNIWIKGENGGKRGKHFKMKAIW